MLKYIININKDNKNLKGSNIVEEEEEDRQFTDPHYSDEEAKYIKELKKKLERARDMRNKEYEEFDGMTYEQYYNTNISIANSAIKAQKNKAEVNYKSGTLRTKMMSLLSYMLGLNLKADITAFSKDDLPINILGNALEDIIEKTEESEDGRGDEKKLLRQYELLVQGTVFLEDIWDKKIERQKDISVVFDGKINKAKWKTREVEKEGQPIRNIIPGKSIYLGNLKEYFIENQPYIFTVETMDRIKAEQIYGKWERWEEYVSKDRRMFLSSLEDKPDNNWNFFDDTAKDKVEIIKYQDKFNHEYQIIINGVPMLPMGYPFPWGYNEYSIVQQNLEPIRHNFAYGKSFVFKNKNMISLLDEMMKLAVLKTQKSFVPPYINLSGRVISKKVFMPGEITRGIEQGSLIPVSDKEVQGVTAGEFNMIQEVKKQVDAETVSQTFTGSKEEGGNVTATQIVQLQKQAKMMMGLSELTFALLEEKLTMKRLMILLKNWFNPIDNVLDETRKQIKDRYRIASVEREIEGEGQGVRITTLSNELPSSEEVRGIEDQMKDSFGKPFRLVVLNPQEVQSTKLTWKVKVNPKQKESSEASKLMFGAEIENALAIGLPLNPDWLKERFAETWEENPDKMFGVPQEQQEQQGQQGAQMAQGAAQEAMPAVKAPKTTATKESPQGVLAA